jgi:hypothetical protein
MSYQSIYLWACLCAASPVSHQTGLSTTTAGNMRADGMFWYTVTSAGALCDRTGPYVLSGCASQSPISASGFVAAGPYYIIGGFWSSEFSTRFSPDRSEVVTSALKPDAFRLYRNYPNPFRRATRISYDVPVGGKIYLSIYDADGRQIKELVEGSRGRGRYSLNWDGRDKTGRTCPAGVYFCCLKAEDYYAAKKMLIAE